MGPHVVTRPLAGPVGHPSVEPPAIRAVAAGARSARRRWVTAVCWQAVMTASVLAVTRGAIDAATVPTGPPQSYTGDAWPSPSRTLWVDRCGGGIAGVWRA